MTRVLHSRKGLGHEFWVYTVIGLLVIAVSISIFILKPAGKVDDLNSCSTWKGDLVKSPEGCDSSVSREVTIAEIPEDQQGNDVYCCAKKDGISYEKYSRWLQTVKVSEKEAIKRAISFEVNDKFLAWNGEKMVDIGKPVDVLMVKEEEEGDYCNLSVYRGEMVAGQIRILKEDSLVETKEELSCGKEAILPLDPFKATEDVEYYIIKAYVAKKKKGDDPLHEAIAYLKPQEPSPLDIVVKIEQKEVTENGKKVCYLYAHTTHTPPKPLLEDSQRYEEGATGPCTRDSTLKVDGSHFNGFDFITANSYCFYFEHAEAGSKHIILGEDDCDLIKVRDKAGYEAES